MSDNELLLAISNMLAPVREEMKEMKEEMKEMKKEMREEMRGLKSRVTKIEIIQENEILPRLQNIESCYISTYDRYQSSAEDCETLKSDMEIVKKVVAEHSEKLQKIG